ncbi:MAG: peptidylprolyl isomerase, partial [Ignavibacteriae bacterium]|nr:peptidylprolyl isomerase [Ignavibacteriota bacterium]
DNDPEIKKELEDYRKSIGVSYLLEKELVEKGLHDLYNKRADELRVSHLLIRTEKISDEEAKAKADEIIARIKNGASFEEEVKANSDDTFSKENGGDIYYITAGNILPAFEDLAYNTKVGEVNLTPLKTQYGYHILKVTDRRKRIPQIQASHILISKKQEANDSSNAAALALAKDILERIKKGEDFATLAKEYSEDPGSKEVGGDLGFFSRRQMVQPFDEAAFNLQVGEVSDIVETKFGYHIIKQTGRKEYASFDDEKQNIKDIFEKTRRKIEYDKLLEQYAAKLNYIANDANIKEIISNSDSTLLNDNYWESELHNNYGSKEIFTIDNKPYSFDSLVSYTMLDPKTANNVLNGTSISNFINKFKEDKVFEVEADKKLSTNVEFNKLMQDYKNGILIFKLQESEIWNKMAMDSVAIKNLYEQTKESYTLPDRVQFLELYATKDSIIENYMDKLKSGTPFEELMREQKDRAETKSYKNELKEVGSSLVATAAFKLNNEGDHSGIIKGDKGFSLVQLIKKDPARIKTFDEARAEVTSAYQDIESANLENEYIARLRKTYEPKIFYDELPNAFKN